MADISNSSPKQKIRISKIMASQGLCSRREADYFIQQGWVFVDGQQITTLGTKIFTHQAISLSPKAHAQLKQRVTILLNKPVGYVSGQPEKGYPAALQLITPQNHFVRDRSPLHFQVVHRHHLAPAGRLDIDSQGLLVFTQDGRIARQLVGTNSSIEKEYLVRVKERINADALKRLQHGLALDDKPLRPVKIVQLNQDILQFILWEGRKRQIRRMCQLVGLTVVGLKRVRIGKVRLGSLPLGKWRYLGRKETF